MYQSALIKRFMIETTRRNMSQHVAFTYVEYRILYVSYHFFFCSDADMAAMADIHPLMYGCLMGWLRRCVRDLLSSFRKCANTCIEKVNNYEEE
jgi:hypothetical protein